MNNLFNYFFNMSKSPPFTPRNKYEIIYVKNENLKLHQPKRKMRQDYLFLYILKLCFR